MATVPGNSFGTGKKKNRTIESSRWRNYIFPVLAQAELDNLTKKDYFKLREFLENRKLSPQTIHHGLSLLRRILNNVIELEEYSGNIPTFNKVMPRFDNRRSRFLSEKEVKILFLSLESAEHWLDISIFALNTGMRKGEIFEIRWENIDYNNKLINIVDTKTQNNRIIPMNSVVLKLLKRNESNKLDDYVFHFSKPKLFINAVKLSGLNDGITDRRQKFVFHTLRHTFASWLILEGIPIVVVSKLLGHRNISTTMRYSHIGSDIERHSVDRIMDKYLGNKEIKS